MYLCVCVWCVVFVFVGSVPMRRVRAKMRAICNALASCQQWHSARTACRANASVRTCARVCVCVVCCVRVHAQRDRAMRELCSLSELAHCRLCVSAHQICDRSASALQHLYITWVQSKLVLRCSCRHNCACHKPWLSFQLQFSNTKHVSVLLASVLVLWL